MNRIMKWFGRVMGLWHLSSMWKKEGRTHRFAPTTTNNGFPIKDSGMTKEK